MKHARRAPVEDKERVFHLLRSRIAEALQRDDLVVRQASQLELAIGTFAPSEMVEGFRISDYPFISARYLSMVDGHVYIVYGATEDGQSLVAYRQSFLLSCVTHRGGVAVAVSPDAWMSGRMIMFSLNHAGMAINGSNQLTGLSMDVETRRSYPFKKAKVYFACWMRRLGLGYCK